MHRQMLLTESCNDCRNVIMLFDQMHILDVLKSAKVSLADDIAMARHAQQQLNSSQQDQEEDVDYDGLLEFLEDPWWCVKLLHSCTKQVNYQHRVVGRIVQYICDSLTDKVHECCVLKYWHKLQKPRCVCKHLSCMWKPCISLLCVSICHHTHTQDHDAGCSFPVAHSCHLHRLQVLSSSQSLLCRRTQHHRLSGLKAMRT